MDESMSVLIAVVVGVLLVATLMFLLIPEPSNSVSVSDTRFDVAVLGFRNSSTWRGIEETVRSRTEAELVNTSGIGVFSRAQLDALLIERALSVAGPIDAATAVEIGSLTGVNKLISGSVYAVDTRTDATTVCVNWSGGQCVTQVPGTAYSVRVMAQIEVVDVATGQIERVFDVNGSDSVSLPLDSTFGGFDSLLAGAATQIADGVSRTLTSFYFRELRYGLYKEVEEKRGGYIGHGETDRFSASDGAAYLVVHFTQMDKREPFDVEWLMSDGSTIRRREEDLVGEGDWRVYSLNLTGLAAGRYSVRATLSGTLAFQEPFTVSR